MKGHVKPDGPILSILIPTFCRHKILLGLLLEIKQQLSCFKNQEIEVIVCDNSPNPLLIPKELSFVKYFHNEKNLGIQGNIEKLILKSSGKYSWFLSDDDLILQNGIKTIYENIKECGDYDRVVLIEASKRLRGEITKKLGYFERSSCYYIDWHEGVNVIFKAINFISIIIVKTKEAIKVLDEYKYLDPIFPHTLMTWMVLLRSSPPAGVWIIKEPIIIEDEGLKWYEKNAINNVAVLGTAKHLSRLHEIYRLNKGIDECGFNTVINKTKLKLKNYIVYYGILSIIIGSQDRFAAKIYFEKYISLLRLPGVGLSNKFLSALIAIAVSTKLSNVVVEKIMKVIFYDRYLLWIDQIESLSPAAHKYTNASSY